MYSIFFKRFFDLCIAVTAVIILSPVLLIVAIVLSWANRGRVFFVQPRPGKNEKIFLLIKFKSMNDLRAKDGELLPDTDRLTAVGKFIRKTSLDELPQLINVIKGDMSLIGPRPLLPRYLPFYTEDERLRHSIRPGITGWAQVNGRNFLSWDKRLKADIYYVNNLSLMMDVRIFFKTLLKVFSGKDIALDQSKHIPDFDHYRAIQQKSITD